MKVLLKARGGGSDRTGLKMLRFSMRLPEVAARVEVGWGLSCSCAGHRSASPHIHGCVAPIRMEHYYALISPLIRSHGHPVGAAAVRTSAGPRPSPLAPPALHTVSAARHATPPLRTPPAPGCPQHGLPRACGHLDDVVVVVRVYGEREARLILNAHVQLHGLGQAVVQEGAVHVGGQDDGARLRGAPLR